ncbi:YbaB/EbfC family nucleoid-associated protein [Loigolactobacillus backii]|nr:YbaB/EbfC family nucleoid-associated protein [Loigolactobacillus backii]
MMRGMGNMQGMMKKMQKMQKEMEQAQNDLNATAFTGKASDDAVVVTFTGDKQMTDISIKPEAIDPDDPDMLQDLIIMAVNNAMNEIDTKTQATMGKYSKGMNIPGM